jgi:phosphopantetheinyl transferase
MKVLDAACLLLRRHSTFKSQHYLMPAPTILSLNGDCTVLLRPITEDEPTLLQGLELTPSEQDDLSGIHHPAQRVEWLACRTAIRQLIQRQEVAYVGLHKDEFGKPHLVGLPWSISLSHTSGWAAAVLHRSRPVGIDIEPIRDQFRRVVPRVLSTDEIAHANGDPGRLAVYWCAKEALYKLYGKRNLTFRDHLYIEPFADGASVLTGHVRLPNNEAKLTIHCLKTGPGLLAVAF